MFGGHDGYVCELDSDRADALTRVAQLEARNEELNAILQRLEAENESLRNQLKPHTEDPGGYLAVGGFVSRIQQLEKENDFSEKYRADIVKCLGMKNSNAHWGDIATVLGGRLNELENIKQNVTQAINFVNDKDRSRDQISWNSGVLSNEITAPFCKLREKLETEKILHGELRGFHDTCIMRLYEMLGVDGSDGEYRFKWASLALHGKLDEIEKLKKRVEELESNSPFLARASDRLALAVFDIIERDLWPTRTYLSDTLESWAAIRFDEIGGNEIKLLREFAKLNPIRD